MSFTGIELRKLLGHLAGSFLRAFLAALGVGFFSFLVQCCRTRGRSRAIWMHAGAVLVAPNLVPSTVFFARDVFLFVRCKGQSFDCMNCCSRLVRLWCNVLPGGRSLAG